MWGPIDLILVARVRTSHHVTDQWHVVVALPILSRQMLPVVGIQYLRFVGLT